MTGPDLTPPAPLSRPKIIRRRRLIIAAPLLAVAGIALYFIAGRDDASSTPRASLADTPAGAADHVGVKKGDLARDFVATAPDGRMVRLSDLRGKPAIVNFWATWCTSCLAELPEFKALQERAGAENIAVVAINAGEDGATAQRFLDELGAEAFRIGMDPTLVVADAYGVFGLPTSIFIDGGGVVRGVYAGQLTHDDLQSLVDASVAGNQTDDPRAKLRLVTTVARDHVLEVRETARDRIEFRAKSLRCDETYCANAAIDTVARYRAVLGVDRYLDEDPPRLAITYEPQVVSADELVGVLEGALAAQADPLYERPLRTERR